MLSSFVLQNDENKLEVVIRMTIEFNDPFLQIIKQMRFDQKIAYRSKIKV